MSDGANKLFEPDALLPEQFFSGTGRDDGAGNERHLMLAILRDAVECHLKYARTRNHQGQEIFEEAHEWIFSRDREWPFSFENICDTLGVNSEYIRSGLTSGSPMGRLRERRRPQIVSVSERRVTGEDFAEPEALPRAS
jgi:hypothetical protein